MTEEFPTTRSSFPAEDEIDLRATGEPIEMLVIYDEPEECPYLSDRVARMPLQFPMQRIDLAASEALFESGYRRSGKFLYRADCPSCSACEAIRVQVGRFRPNRSQRRALKKGNSVFDMKIGAPLSDESHVELFNRHRDMRDLNRHDHQVDAQEYRMFLVESCLDSFEISYLFEGQLVCGAICDRAADSVSAVYTYFEPDFSEYSPGTYSVLKQIEYCRQLNLSYLYLGYYVAGSGHMNYKQNFRPHQKLQNGTWNDFE